VEARRMRSPKTATVVVLAGGVALASAAYGIGTQVDGGTATARDDAVRGDGPPARLFDGLADELGVDADELRDALMDFGERQHSERRDAFAAALAKALGKPADEVQAALDEVRPDDGDRGPCGPHVSLRRLASALDVSRAELRKALREVRADADSAWEDRRDDLAAFLAERFNLSKDKVEEALPEPRWPFHDGPRFRGPGGPGFDGPPGWPGG
jgi:hypothetical protein